MGESRVTRRRVAIVLATLAVLAYVGHGVATRSSPDEVAEQMQAPSTSAPDPEHAGPATLVGREAAADGPAAPDPDSKPAIVGVVSDPHGDPVAGTTVRAWLATRSPTGSRVTAPPVAAAETDASGSFRIDGIPKGVYELRADDRKGWAAPLAVVAYPGATVERSLAYGIPVSAVVEVVDDRGAPVEGATVTVSRYWRQVHRTRTDAVGLATLRNLDPRGTLSLAVRGPRHLGTTIDPWTVEDTRVVLEQFHTVRVRVVDEEGTPFSGALFLRRSGPSPALRDLQDPAFRAFRWSGGQLEGLGYQSAVAPEDGTRTFELTRTESLAVAIRPPGRLPAGKPRLTTISGRKDEMTVVLPRGRDQDVRVLDWGRGMNGYVDFRSLDDDDFVRVTLSAEGRARASHLAAGATYVVWGRVWVVAKRFEDDGYYVYRNGVTPGDAPVELTVARGEAITVDVTCDDERVRVLHVMACGRGIHAPGTRGVNPRSWTIHGLPPGPWTVHARGVRSKFDPRRGGRPDIASATASTTARPGDHVRLELRPAEAE